MADTNTYDLFQKVEKWTTKEKFNELGNLTEIETGTEYNLTGAIEENDLDSDLQTKINGKLTAPTAPTADSAVTLLADGTVGTKPLSEISGKLYRHHILGSFESEMASIQVDIIKNFGMPMTENDFQTYVGTITVAAFTGMNGQGSVIITYNSDGAQYIIQGAVLNTNNTGAAYFVNLIKNTFDSFTDTVTEL